MTSRKEFRYRSAIERRALPWPFAALFGAVCVFGAIKSVWTAPAAGTFRLIAFAVAAALSVGGVVLLRMALRGFVKFQARIKRQENHPHEPWLWSRRPWDPEMSASLEPNQGVFRFGRFPFRLGGDVTGRLMLTGPLASASRLALNLRHMEEEPVPGIMGSGRQAMTVWSAWEHCVEVDGHGEMTVQLPLPSDANLTSEFGPFSKYWVLDVETVPPSAARASFVLPVYPA
jgi:hypothetical protein